jgi:hypothetical protein
VVFAAGFVGGSRVAEASSPPDTIIYGANGYGRAEVVEINLTQKTFDRVGDVVRETQAIDQDPATGLIYFYEWRHTADEFGYFDPQTGGSVIVRQYSPAPGLYAKRMAFGPDGVLYMMDDNDVLYTIDKSNGDLTLLGAVSGLVNGQWGGTGDMAFAPDGTLYVATYRNLYTVDVGALTSTLLYSNMIPVTGVGITLWTGLAFCDGVLYASNAEQNTELSAIFSIDPATGAEQLEFYTSFVFNDLSSCSAVPVVNDPPVAVDGSVSVPEDGSVGAVLSASDPDGDALSFEVVGGPSNGSLSGTALPTFSREKVTIPARKVGNSSRMITKLVCNNACGKTVWKT